MHAPQPDLPVAPLPGPDDEITLPVIDAVSGAGALR